MIGPSIFRARALTLLFGLMLGCGASEGPAAGDVADTNGDAESSLCPASAPAPDPLPNVSPAHLTLSYWLERGNERGDLDDTIMTSEQVRAHNRALTEDPENGLPIDRGSLSRAPEPARLTREVSTRLAYLREKLESGEYVDAAGQRVDASAFEDRPLNADAELRIALEPTPMRCGPRAEGLFKQPIDPAFDRNNCSTIRPQEPVQRLARWPNGMWLARTRYSIGWIPEDAPLSPVVAAELASSLLGGRLLLAPSGTTLRSDDGASVTLSEQTVVAADLEDGTSVLFASPAGIHRASASGLTPTARPLTRRAFLEEAFRRVGRPYGWGGQDGGIDCSRFVMDVLGTFGLELPRHSARQALAGTYSIDISEIADLEERQRLLDAADRQGIVLLQFPGHIMIYLGRDGEGTPRIIHAFSEYLERCGDTDDETVRRADRVAVSDLSLGEGTSRTAFIERLTRITILGGSIGPELIGVAERRAPARVEIPPPSAPCEDSLATRIFRSPERPHPDQPLRLFVTSTEELGPVEIALLDPNGERHVPELRRLGGPPFTYWVEIDRPMAGRWRAAVGDGATVHACERVTVARYTPPREPAEPSVVWRPRFRWEADTEALFSAFVEQLFDFPIEEELTWPNLSVLLSNPRQNILFNHFGLDEEERIQLQPDCADLPYFLRTYFAWKMRLPFGYRACTRGRRGQLPVCEELQTTFWEHERADPVDAFARFIGAQVKQAVHSASGRTHPEDSATALYPVPLTREALRPGTVFADPYGHLLVVARWIPQGTDDYGILVGADAQPDGTVGRRRFWRGSFLFHPDTEHVGAGFKGWRPVVFDPREETFSSVPNEEITARAGYTPFSMEQYQRSADDFYERMEELINPRPLDPLQVQISLIDALDESIARRVVSVSNGEGWIRDNPGRTMEMPEGGAIFQTGGPWEDFSTPSRDMRLLIAMDTVTGFVDVIRRNPARFGLEPDQVEDAVARVTARRDEILRERVFTYTRSTGQVQELSLHDVLERAPGFEMSYNPNDCIEIRWAAPQSSPEMRSCGRHAPAEHRARMREYREWFSTRRRPIY